MHIINSTDKDTAAIFDLYDKAIAYQKTKWKKHWQPFDQEMVRKEIEKQRQWKILDENNNILCIFATTFNDPDIWEEKDKEPSIYLHRIVTNPDFRGGKYVQYIIEWAKVYGKANGRQFIRMDTWGDNQQLIEYYKSCGFNYLGVFTPSKTEALPKHYSDISLSFFEIKIQ